MLVTLYEEKTMSVPKKTYVLDFTNTTKFQILNKKLKYKRRLLLFEKI
jgi:hypothetical protein